MLDLNKIYNIDCLTGMAQIADKSIDMIFVDLPYGVTAHNKWDSVIPFEPMWEQFERIIKDDGAILLFGQDKFSAKLMLSNEKLHRYNIIWKKTTPTGFLNANRMPLRNHEDIMVFYKSLPTYNPQKTTGHKRKVSKAAIHPTQKPIDLCRYAIRTYTNEGDTVLDCCCGSGSIPLAAKLEGRNYIGMDNGVCEKKNSEYFGKPWAEVAKMRISNNGI